MSSKNTKIKKVFFYQYEINSGGYGVTTSGGCVAVLLDGPYGYNVMILSNYCISVGFVVEV